MTLRPVNFIHYGDLYRFFLDTSALPEISLAKVEMFEGGTTHSEEVEWKDVPLDLKEMLIEKVQTL